jgi:hypothetical protein
MTEYPRPPRSIDTDLADIPADPRVTATLCAVVGEAPYHTVDWDTLRASIVGDAAAFFARRAKRSWTTYVARWSSTAVPVGVAASIMAGLFMMYASDTTTTRQVSDTDLSPSALFSTVSGTSTGTALAATVTASFDDDTRIQALFGDIDQ